MLFPASLLHINPLLPPAEAPGQRNHLPVSLHHLINSHFPVFWLVFLPKRGWIFRNHKNARILPVLWVEGLKRRRYAHCTELQRAASLNIDQPIFPRAVFQRHLLTPCFNPWLDSSQHRGTRSSCLHWARLGTAAPWPSRSNVMAKGILGSATETPTSDSHPPLPWKNWAGDHQFVSFPTSAQSSWNPFHLILGETSCLWSWCWATPASNWEVTWDHGHLQALGIDLST